MWIGGRPGWPLRTVHLPRRARDKRHCCHLSIPLTDRCHSSECCSARSRSWQRPCAAAGQIGLLAQIFHDCAAACGERKPSSSKACIDLLELACQPVPTLAKSGLLKRADVSFISAQNSTKSYAKNEMLVMESVQNRCCKTEMRGAWS